MGKTLDQLHPQLSPHRVGRARQRPQGHRLVVRVEQPVELRSNEPIDLFSGAYLYDHDDLAVGSGAYPFTLGFRRSYNSNNAGAVGPLGAGWTHNFDITALINSDGLKGLGQDSPIDGAAAIAATYVIQDLLSDTSKPIDKVVVATLVQKWLMDRLINNTVNITNGSQGEQFVLLADGSYNAQLGSTDRLTLSGGAYTLMDKYGTTTAFNTAGNVTQWQTPAGTSVSFNGTTTISITDADNREVLEYDGGSGNILRWYAYGLGPNDLLSQNNVGVSPTRASLISDLLGSVIGSMSNGGVLTSFAYRAYGLSASPPAQFAFAGQRIDAETGLYYFRSRHYHPGWGRLRLWCKGHLCWRNTDGQRARHTLRQAKACLQGWQGPSQGIGPLV